MKLHQTKAWAIAMLIALGMCFANFSLSGQSISGKVNDSNNEPLIGASVLVKGTTQGTVTDISGQFTLDNVPASSILVVSFVGFATKEVAAVNNLVIVLSEGGALDEVVVTGVFDARTKMNASVAISSLSSKQLEKIVPNSAIDVLKNMPGVYVNTARGEVGNSIYTRGLNYSGGFFYVSMQEDGLPVMGISGLVNPDGYLRADATIHRVEAVRGGTASILGPNAPGGIFNYVSKTGGQNFEGEIRARFGLEGDGQNPYYRTDLNVGGPLNKAKDLTFNIGGFYRNADGPKYPGYTLSYGGQLKANFLKKYKTGSLKLYAKLLDDNTAPFEFTPTVDFEKPKPAGSFTNTSSTLVQSQQFTVPGSITAGKTLDYDTRKVGAYNEVAGGLQWEQKLGSGWTFNNNLRVSSKEHIAQTTAVVFPFRVDQIVFYGVSGNVARFGTYEFYDPSSNKSYGTVQQLPPTGAGQPIRFIPNNLSLPGGDVLPNALFYNPNPYNEVNFTDIIDQATLSKKFKNMSITAGMYYASTKATRENVIPTAQGFATVEDRPKTVGIRYTNLGGQKFDLTNPGGLANIGASGFYTNDARINQTAFFLGHNWEINNKLNLDWGLRYENFAINSTFTTPRRITPDSPTGADGNAATLYDNRLWANNPEQSFEKDLQSVSYSVGVNYLANENFAVYGRYSQGRKSPDLSYFMDIANQQLTSSISVEAQSIQMAELGFKFKQERFNLFVTPFYTLLSNVPNFQIFQNPDVTYYAPPRVYQKIQTMGLELEGNLALSEHFSIRGVATFQNSKALEFSVFLANANGPQDDKKVSYDGNKNDNIGTMLMITPTYSSKKISAALNYQYMGKRWANVGNAFQLPAFSALDLNLGYNFSTKFQLSASVNNLTNTYGIMSWAAPGGFPAALDTQGFTKGMLEGNPNAVYATLSIMPRAYFLTATYKF
ncbi:MAG: TonB-dependent receptor [Haliscomenobacter sp.]|uniref:TonB-dependent receptor n=1 Tax=Haliscomenobacter sp. TaxID=2717303 RepID=UPI0029BF1CB1|nr:TonB-dependent receptor [Haliscomenobacter sp.]MDX2071524.1 TonB-dependent receptor [Haliscomenobacter sp.]